jgi:hypothetical protein
MADHFFELVEYDAPKTFSLATAYGLLGGQAPMKTFIQERFVSIILSTEKFSVLTPAPNQVPLLVSRMFHFDEDTVSKLRTCEQLKSEFNKSNDSECLEKFRQVRETITFRKPWRYME